MKRGKKVLIVGFGSIAKKYCQILQKKGYNIFILKHRPGLFVPLTFESVTINRIPPDTDYALICSPTSTHNYYLKKLLGKKIPVFVEKPLSDKISDDLLASIEYAKKNKIFIMSGYNFRYLPIFKLISDYLREEKLGKILYAFLHAGQYLPQWRSKPYWESYSSSHLRGGGVALDLIHEIDLALGWFHHLPNIEVIKKKLSHLKIDCEDFVQLTSTGESIIQITIDYLSNIKLRRYLIVGSRGTIDCDVYQSQFIFSRGRKIEKVISSAEYFDTLLTYETQLDFFIRAADKKRTGLINDRFLGVDALALAQNARLYVQK